MNTNTEELNMKHSTPMIIQALRADGEPKLLLLAADRLEELQQKCNMHYETICDLTKERDEARAELKEFKARLESSLTKELVTLIRPEPSRLEIAAMLKSGWFANPEAEIKDDQDPKWWIEQADKLIAAAAKVRELKRQQKEAK